MRNKHIRVVNATTQPTSQSKVQHPITKIKYIIVAFQNDTNLIIIFQNDTKCALQNRSQMCPPIANSMDVARRNIPNT